MSEKKYPKVKIAGIEMEIRSEQDCVNSTKEGGEGFFMCMPKAYHEKAVALGAPEIPGTTSGFPCHLCGTDCVLAPSGQMLHAQGAQITCIDCVMKAVPEKES